MRGAENVVRFGPFRLFLHQRLLLEGDRTLRVGSRALDTLIALAERSGELVSKGELMERVWPNARVDEGSLRVTISALRRAIGDGTGGRRYILSVSGRGYSLVASTSSDSLDIPPPKESSARGAHNLPVAPARLVGRGAASAELVGQIGQHRLLTIVGPGGIGKTSVALAVAEDLLADFQHGVWLVDLASIADGNFVPNALASTLGIPTQERNPLPGLVKALQNKELLVILDNCEHLISDAARLASALLQGAPGVKLLATSREPLITEGEHVYLLTPLNMPDSSRHLTLPDLDGYAAAQLFIERATAHSGEFKLEESDADVVGEICRKLDGIPLAIEFAAAYVAIFGLRGLAAHLEDGLRLPSLHRRTAPDRHRTLRATFDWSVGLLGPSERTILRRLAIFAGHFTLTAAISVAEDGGSTEAEFLDHLGNLVFKSLVSADISGSVARYRLLETTRIYAMEELRAAGEYVRAARAHAEYFAGSLDDMWSDKDKTFAEGGYPAQKDQIGNVRAALQWAFSEDGDTALAIHVGAGASMFFMQLGLMAEAYEWSSRALDAMNATQRRTRQELMLRSAYAQSCVVMLGNTDTSLRAIDALIALSAELKDQYAQIRALGGHHIYLTRTGKHKAAMPVAVQVLQIAEELDDAVARAMANAMLSQSFHYAGDQAKAGACFRAVLQNAPLDQKINTLKYGLDQRVRSVAVSARILWLLGQPGEAAASTRRLLDFSERQSDPIIIVMACYQASVVTSWLGDWEWARKIAAHLKKTSVAHAIRPFPELADSFEADLLFRTAGAGPALPALEASFERVRLSGYNPAYHALGLIEALVGVGRHEDAKRHIDERVADMHQNGQTMFMPEYLRLEAEILNAKGQAGAEAAYLRAIDLAKSQSALAWELRATLGLARLYRSQHPEKAWAALSSVYGRFSEGLETVDLKTARRFLEESLASSAS
ncbi:winged helix-turn-helix domain-containing protein [Bradyrhizobium lablabi]|uniref:ATP-binding protein n=1 Tax=Bradyrhizobium lablabi TaxID=722472 RepID=UPI001BA9EB98|nr:winged helix-turn-helix domain-containing protein [Bradyrhizobium lablabi]MBR1125703.1 winged helix-turn-helix domain-containing protein [Bradyrhizobium lablabi]